MRTLVRLLRLKAGRHRVPVLVIALLFAASRIAAYAAGVRFDSSPLGLFQQLIEPDLLKTRLLESLFYLHSQPPLFNLFLGLLLKAFPAHYAAAAHVIYLAFGFVGALALYGLLDRMGCATWVSVTFTTLITIAPATILYENWLFYEYPIAVLLVLSAFTLAGFVRTKSFWSGFLFFLLLAAVIWTRSVFQIIWMLLAAGLVLVAFRDRKRLVLQTALVPLLLVIALYGKNLTVFGVPNTSSWFGMNLARMVFKEVPRSDRARLVERGKLSRVSLVEPFSPVSAYRGFAPLSRPTGTPVLDRAWVPKGSPNFNNKSYIRISSLYLHDSLSLIREEPTAYLRGIKGSIQLSFLPSVDYGYLLGNRAKIRTYTQGFNHVVYVQTSFAGRIGLAIFGAYVLALLYGLRLLVLWIRGTRYTDPVLVTLLYAWLTVLYVLLILGFTSGFENQRIRFIIDPLVVVLVASAIREAWPARGRPLFGGRVSRSQSPA